MASASDKNDIEKRDKIKIEERDKENSFVLLLKFKIKNSFNS